jgi:DNA-binding MarR family transcriptional regulator
VADPEISEPKWLDDREAKAWRSYLVASQLLFTQLERDLLAESGLSHADYGVLVTLSETVGHELRMNELAVKLTWSKSRLSHQVSRMEKRDLVHRRSCGDDGRGLFVSLTPNGLTAIEGAAPGHVESVRRHLLDHLSPEQVDVMGDMFERVRNHLMGTVACDVVEEADCEETFSPPLRPAPAED